MGVLSPPGPFQQKKAKKRPKKFLKRGREIPFPVPAEEISSAETRNGISLPLSEFFLFFFPLYEYTVEAVLRQFEDVLRLYRLFLGIKPSLYMKYVTKALIKQKKILLRQF